MTVTKLRNADLATLAGVLKDQAASRYDVVANSANLRMQGGNLVIADQEQVVLTDEGVTTQEVALRPTSIFDSGIATRLGIPAAYLGKTRATPDARLYDANVNEWLHAENRSWFIRGFRSEGEECGVARAFLSDRFGCIDSFDMLLAALEGVRAAGVDAEVIGADLSERRMKVRIVVPQVEALAPVLLAGYRSPFDNADPIRARALLDHGWLAPSDRPVVFAGFDIDNSETGCGAFTIKPVLTVLACRNGLTINADALRKVHLGAQMGEGEIEWSDATNRRAVELVRSQATDAVTTFCNVEYIERKIAELTADATTIVAKPTEVIEKVCKELSFTKDEADGILGHFILGGQLTTGGIMQACTSFAQEIADPDRAAAVQENGVEAMVLAKRLALA